MAKHCITAANHKNPNNHVASSFLVWVQDAKTTKWSELGAKSAKPVVELIESGNTVLTGMDRPAFRRHLRAIIYGNRGGQYERQAVHG